MSNLDVAVIKALKSGRVPRRGTRQLAVGRDAEIAEFGRMLAYVCDGLADVRFLRGDYGSGKTFMCSVLREMAFERDMAVSVVNLSREIPFGRRELVLSEVLLGLRTVDCPSEPALSIVLERWYALYDGGTPLEGNEPLREALHRLSAADPQFASALRGHYRAWLDGDAALMEGALDFIRGAAVRSDVRAGLKIAGRLAPEAAFRRLRSVLAVMHAAGYPGLLVLIDEAETIQRLNKTQRDAAYTAIREIVDNCEEQFPNCLFVFAGTQPLFEDEFNGIASYQPLYQRIKNTQATNVRDLRQPIIRLEELGIDALVAVAKRIRSLHAAAYDWNAEAAVPDKALIQFISSVGERFGEIRQKPRGFLKALVDMFDAKQQGTQSIDIEQAVSAITAVEAQDTTLDEDVVIAVA